VSTYTDDRDLAERFITFLNSARGRDIFAKWGYIATEQQAREYAPNAEIGGTYELPELFSSGNEK
jgi:hypothetical protein